MTIEYIDTPEQLDDLCKRIEKESWIALDTEFLREKTYYPKFCLLQIATPDWVVCVDPLSISDLNKLFIAINKPSIIKVLHSCRQDLEIFYQLTNTVISPVFDTQMAAPLIGFPENTSYAMLVSSLLSVNLSKTHTRTDWSIRPLKQAQIEYAADDVIYLGKIYQIIIQKLKSMDRLGWLEKDFEHLKKADLYQVLPIDAWKKVKGKNKLNGKQLAIIQVLSEWREKTAQLENRPKNWLIRDDILLELAKLQPESINDLRHINNINERVVRRYGSAICQSIIKAKQRSPLSISHKKTVKKTPQQEAVLDVLTAVVRLRSAENSINPSILASRKELEKLLFNEAENLILQGWRYHMVGEELEGLLRGQYRLILETGSIFLSKNEST